jgi:signal peptidase I
MEVDMINEEQISGRNNRVAAFMSIIMPGLGQVYNGDLLKGISLFIISVLIPLAGFRLSVFMPVNILLPGILISLLLLLTVYAISVMDAYRKASELNGQYTLKPVNRWYVYVAVWMLGAFMMSAANNYIKANSVQAFKIPSLSMEPAIMQGDMIFVDRTFYRRAQPEVGDIVVFVYPDDRSKMFIKRIAGLPGNEVNFNEQQQIVPHGSVFVLGDNEQHSKDSRELGFVPLRDIIGKTMVVYFSSGPDGIRWDRLGLSLTGRQAAGTTDRHF